MTASHLGDVHQTLDASAQGDESTERNDLGNRAISDGANGELLDELHPRILGGLLQAQRDALAGQVNVQNLDFDFLANLDNLGRMVDVVPRKLGDVNQTVNAAQVNEGAKVNDRGNGAVQAHTLGELLQDFGTLVLAAFLQQHAARKHHVVAVTIHLDNASLELGTQIHIQVLHAAQVNQRCRQEATQADVQNQAALDDFDNLAHNGFAVLVLFFNVVPGTLVLSATLGKNQTTVLVFLLKNQSLNLVAQAHNVSRVDILADGQLANRDNTLALEADVNQNLIMLQFDDFALHQIAFVEVGQGAVDHCVHLIIGDVFEVNDRRVLNLGHGTPFKKVGTRRHDCLLTCTMFALLCGHLQTLGLSLNACCLFGRANASERRWAMGSRAQQQHVSGAKNYALAPLSTQAESV